MDLLLVFGSFLLPLAMLFISVFLLLPRSYSHFHLWKQTRQKKYLVLAVDNAYIAFSFLSALFVIAIRLSLYGL